MNDVVLNQGTRLFAVGLGIELCSNNIGRYVEWPSVYSGSEQLNTFLDIAQRVSKAAAKTFYVLALNELSPCTIKCRDVGFFQAFVWGGSLDLFALLVKLTEPYFGKTVSKEATNVFDFISHFHFDLCRLYTGLSLAHLTYINP